MRITICAVGRSRVGPEKTLCDDYIARFNRTGRSHGFGPMAVSEIEDRKGGGMSAEANLLRSAAPDGAYRIVLDERGKPISSTELAALLSRLRDDGQRDVVFFVGGADGLDPAFRKEADLMLSFGVMVWPHKLARVMLAEQLYRSASILARTPYHRA